MELFKKAADYCKSSGITELIREKNAVIIGFSGGADSSVLLSFFVEQRKIFPDLEIIAAHVNHMIRGEEAERDEAFCREVCRALSVPLSVRRLDIPALSKASGKGLEECARLERYAFFRELAQEHSAAVATAHNADDNLETVIFNLTRGSGTKGISGISPVRDGIYVRPLLSCTSEEIRSFAKEQDISYVTDSTNTDTAYTRNAIRHNVIPTLKQINPKVADAALRLSRAAREDCGHIEEEARRLIGEDGRIPPAVAKSASPALFARVLRELYERKRGKAENLSDKNISDARKITLSPEGGSVSLPAGLAFFADKDAVFIDTDVKYKKAPSDVSDTVPLPIGKTVDLGDFCVTATLDEDYINNIEENIYNLSLHTALDCDKISIKLYIKKRSPGDTFLYHKLQRKLKKLMCDEGVPRHLRDTIPIIRDSDGILVVPFVGQRDGTAPDKNTKQILHIHIYGKNKNI